MKASVLALHDRALPTTLYVPAEVDPAPLIAFGHGFYEAADEPKRIVMLEGAGHDICQDSGVPHFERVAEITTAFWDECPRG